MLNCNRPVHDYVLIGSLRLEVSPPKMVRADVEGNLNSALPRRTNNCSGGRCHYLDRDSIIYPALINVSRYSVAGFNNSSPPVRSVAAGRANIGDN